MDTKVLFGLFGRLLAYLFLGKKKNLENTMYQASA